MKNISKHIGVGILMLFMSMMMSIPASATTVTLGKEVVNAKPIKAKKQFKKLVKIKELHSLLDEVDPEEVEPWKWWEVLLLILIIAVILSPIGLYFLLNIVMGWGWALFLTLIYAFLLFLAAYIAAIASAMNNAEGC